MLARQRTLVLALSLLIIATSCVTLTRSQKILWALDIYEHQYDLYLEQVIDPSVTGEKRAALKADTSLITPDVINPLLTDEQKEALRVKKLILIELKPLVLIAAEANKTGSLPSEDVLNKMTKLINELLIQGE